MLLKYSPVMIKVLYCIYYSHKICPIQLQEGKRYSISEPLFENKTPVLFSIFFTCELMNLRWYRTDALRNMFLNN